MAKKILQVNIRVFLVLKLLSKFFGIISNLWIEPSGFVELYYTFVHRNYAAIVQAGESMMCVLAMVYFHLEI